MICADVPSLARAAPNPAVSTRVNARDGDSTFDQLLQAVTPDRSADQSSTAMSDAASSRQVDVTTARQTHDDTNATRQPVDRKDQRDDVRQDKDTTAEAKPADRKSSESKKSDDKPVNDKKTDDASSVKDEAETKSAEDTVKEAIAAAMAAQAAIVAKPDVKPEMTEKAAGTTETAAAIVTAPVVQQQQQTPVIKLPDAEPQPLPEELNQVLQTAKVEVKDFKNLVDNASKNLDTQAQATAAPAAQTTATSAVSSTPALQNLSTQEQAVKVVQVTAQPEDMAAVDSTKALTAAYASAAKTENLVETKPLPIIQKISSEVVELAREQGKSMKIQIQPENMGKIDLRLISNSDGMRIVMTTEVPATGKLLETHMDQLQRQLADAGVSISGMSVNSQNAQGQSANASQNQSSGSGRPSTPVFQPEAETAAPTTARVTASGLDYRI